MGYLGIFFSYWWWHYTTAIADLSRNYKNLLRFLFDFFSIRFLLRTLFVPFRRLGERYPTGLDLGGMAGTFIVNSLMRLVGVLVKLFLIVIALLVITLSLAGFVVVFIAWLILPIIIIYFTFFALNLILLK